MSSIFLRVSSVVFAVITSAAAIADPVSAPSVAPSSTPKSTDKVPPPPTPPAAVDERYRDDMSKPREPNTMDATPANVAPVDSTPSIHRPPAPTEGKAVTPMPK